MTVLTIAPVSRPAAVEPTYRTAPQNIEAEQALLGAILVNNRAFEKVSEFLKPEHFYDSLHGRIFDAIGRLVERGQNADPVTLKALFESDQDMVKVGGPGYLAELAARVVTVVNALDYGKIIHDLYLRRQLIDVGETLVTTAYTHDVDVSAMDQIEAAEKSLYDLATTGDVQGGLAPLVRALDSAYRIATEAFQRGSQVTGVTTGLIDMDRKLGGLHPSDLVILAGRPSMGKTALATNIAFSAAREHFATHGKEGAVAAFFSLEMSSEQLATRIMAEEARVASDRIRRGDVREADFGRFVEVCQELGRLPLYIDDTPALSVPALRTRARRLKRTHGLGLVIIDYLQLMRGAGGGNKSENRVQELSEITRGLKAIAKELQVPVVALSQLSRAVEARDDKRPQLADLRESGSIEQDADVVMFVYREQYYLERAEPARRPEETEDKHRDRYERWQQRLGEVHNTAEVIIAKQRHGPIGTVRLHFDGEFTKFSDLETRQGGDGL